MVLDGPNPDEYEVYEDKWDSLFGNYKTSVQVPDLKHNSRKLTLITKHLSIFKNNVKAFIFKVKNIGKLNYQ